MNGLLHNDGIYTLISWIAHVQRDLTSNEAHNNVSVYSYTQTA